MPWDCKFDKAALKDVQKIPQQQQKRILQAIGLIAKDPYRPHNKIKRLGGVLTGYFRFRLGNYRIVYLLNPDAQTMLVTAVLPRNEKTYK